MAREGPVLRAQGAAARARRPLAAALRRRLGGGALQGPGGGLGARRDRRSGRGATSAEDPSEEVIAGPAPSFWRPRAGSGGRERAESASAPIITRSGSLIPAGGRERVGSGSHGHHKWQDRRLRKWHLDEEECVGFLVPVVPRPNTSDAQAEWVETFRLRLAPECHRRLLRERAELDPEVLAPPEGHAHRSSAGTRIKRRQAPEEIEEVQAEAPRSWGGCGRLFCRPGPTPTASPRSSPTAAIGELSDHQPESMPAAPAAAQECPAGGARNVQRQPPKPAAPEREHGWLQLEGTAVPTALGLPRGAEESGGAPARRVLEWL